MTNILQYKSLFHHCAYLVTRYAGFSLLAHSPRSTLGKYIYFAQVHNTTKRVLQSAWRCLTTGPMVPLAPFCPTKPTSPCSPVGPLSPRWPWWPLLPWREAIIEQVCTESTNFPEQFCRQVRQFKHLILRVCLTCLGRSLTCCHAFTTTAESYSTACASEWKVC